MSERALVWSPQAPHPEPMELLLARLPKPPARVLEVVAGVEPATPPLAAFGYAVTTVAPTAELFASPMEPSVIRRVGGLEAPAESYNAIVFRESTHSLDPLVGFGKSYELLVDGGTLLLLGQVGLRRTEPGIDPYALLEHLLRLGESCGFALVERLAELDTAQERDADGRHDYALLHFRKTRARRWRVSYVREGDFPAVFDLFKAVFGHEMTPALWRWKYADGRGQATIAWRGDELVAHYGGITRAILFFGVPQHAVQVCDVMVRPVDRSVLTTRGPFFLTAARFLELYTGYGAKHVIGFGFPNGRHMRLGEKLGLYGEVDRITEINWEPLVAASAKRMRIRLLDPARPKREQRIVDRLWAQMRGDLRHGIVGVRDWRYLLYRYLHHPEKRYDVILISTWLTRRPQGIIVLRRDGKSCELLDLVAPLENLPVLIECARRLTARWNAKRLYCWITHHHAPRFLETGGVPVDPDIHVPWCIAVSGPSVGELKDRWWLMSGDTEFR